MPCIPKSRVGAVCRGQPSPCATGSCAFIAGRASHAAGCFWRGSHQASSRSIALSLTSRLRIVWRTRILSIRDGFTSHQPERSRRSVNRRRLRRCACVSSMRIAATWAESPASAVPVQELVTQDDQWTLEATVHPFDVSQTTGGVVQHTTRKSRLGAYFGAIPQYRYLVLPPESGSRALKYS